MVFILIPQFLTVPAGIGPAKGEGLTGADVVLSSDTLGCTYLFTTDCGWLTFSSSSAKVTSHHPWDYHLL